ncbi:hypothetical protein WNY37_08720 [Henriciella sp. AS95]|uniref:hypothetical protein n=1 Tax=Henriciella sp. AS95 TaxID=3135782 RepID=UPI00318020ED
MNRADTHRKRLRVYAAIFMGAGILQGLAALIIFTGESEVAPSEALGHAMAGLIYFFCGLMAWHGSRAACLAILFWVLTFGLVEIVVEGLDTNATRNVIQLLIFGGLALRMCVNAFLYWRAVHNDETAELVGRPWVRLAGWIVVLPISAFLLVGVLASVLPGNVSFNIVSGSDIDAEQLAWMRQENLLDAEERPLLFYSDGFFSIKEDGNLLTDKYLGSWWQESDGELVSAWIRLGAICKVEPSEANSDFRLSAYAAYSVDDREPVVFWLPKGDPLHQAFIERIGYLNARHTNAELSTACEEGRSPDWSRVAKLNGLPGGAIEAHEISRSILNWLRGEEYLLTGEEPLWLSSTASFDLEEGGVLMSDSYFGGWWQESGVTDSVWFAHGGICEIEILAEESNDITTRYRASGPGNENYLSFSLPAGTERTEQRIALLRQVTSERQTSEQAEACATGVTNTDAEDRDEEADSARVIDN